VSARTQFAVREVLQRLRQQRLRSVDADGGKRSGPGPARRVDLAEAERGERGTQQRGWIAGNAVRGVEAATQQDAAALAPPPFTEHRAHALPVPLQRRVGLGRRYTAQRVEAGGRVPHCPGGLGRAEQGFHGPLGVVRGEQHRRGEQRFPGVGYRPVAQGEQPAYVVGAAGRRYDTHLGQEVAGSPGVPAEPGVLRRGGQPVAAKGLVGREQGGPGQSHGSLRVRPGCGGRPCQRLRQRRVVVVRRTGPLDQPRQGPVRAVEQCGQQKVYGTAAGERGAAQEGGAQQRMGEADPYAVVVDRARPLGRSQAAGIEPGHLPGAHQQRSIRACLVGFVLLRGGGEQQQQAGVLGE
jgi:hypothetical protein